MAVSTAVRFSHKGFIPEGAGSVNPFRSRVCGWFVLGSRLGAGKRRRGGRGQRLDRRSTRVAGLALTPAPGGA